VRVSVDSNVPTPRLSSKVRSAAEIAYGDGWADHYADATAI